MQMETEVICRTILDIDHCVLGIEKIALKYLSYPTGVFYVEGIREPMTNSHYVSHFIKKKVASETPLHPLYGMYMLRDTFYLYLRELIATSDLTNAETILNTNTLIPNGDKIYEGYHQALTVEDIVKHHIPNINEDDLIDVIKDLNHNKKWIKKIAKQRPLSLYNINISGKHIVIEEGIDIRAYRFQEAVVYNEIVAEIAREEFHGD
jgi:hypothetical protein